MGLDMYLTKRTYIGAKYEHRKINGTLEIKEDEKNIPINLKRVSSIEESIGYWRKANHIHGWFVENVQDGKDDCGEHCVSREELESLLLKCDAVLSDKTKADTELPVRNGFFFGSDSYGEYYFECVLYTKKLIEDILIEQDADKANNHYADYYYSSSW